MKILIKVTKEILAKSANCNLYGDTKETLVSVTCAIALSIRELFPNSSAGPRWVSLGNERIKVDLPPIASSFIYKFDSLNGNPEARKAMQPISFEIDVPNELIEKIGIGEVYKILSESKTLEHVN